MIATSAIPIFSLGDKKIGDNNKLNFFIEEVVKKGNLKLFIDKVQKELNKNMKSYEKDYYFYLDKYLKDKEDFNIHLSLYLFDEKTEEYVVLRKGIGLKLDKELLDFIMKNKNNTKSYKLLELGLNESCIDMYHMLASNRYSILPLEEFKIQHQHKEQR